MYERWRNVNFRVVDKRKILAAGRVRNVYDGLADSVMKALDCLCGSVNSLDFSWYLSG